jgi:hypothetical protein
VIKTFLLNCLKLRQAYNIQRQIGLDDTNRGVDKMFLVIVPFENQPITGRTALAKELFDNLEQAIIFGKSQSNPFEIVEVGVAEVWYDNFEEEND